MAKKRASVFNTDTSKQEIEKEAKKIEQIAIEGSEKSGKLMHLYVDEEHHSRAKINAVKRGMKLGEYIEWLIREDKP